MGGIIGLAEFVVVRAGALGPARSAHDALVAKTVILKAFVALLLQVNIRQGLNGRWTKAQKIGIIGRPTQPGLIATSRAWSCVCVSRAATHRTAHCSRPCRRARTGARNCSHPT